ncbi:hypothetical protein RHGRI_016218 [Rhododendron griersonianum]|uniref:Uncharacterized protein n=1 Tax=Rhododendron griersonianum TaxID=479676 RepID=A0AAV6JTF9_9ERIC|nr:hypothetical protein RHGRI_016218 [Rhododendron griersonianum]
MEVVIPTNDFHFNTSPFSTSPSTPKGFGHFSLTAPSSPTRISEFYRDFDDEFAFDFRLESEGTTLPAEELFESGKIRSSNPPSRFGEPNKKTHLRTEQGRGRERNPSIRNTDKRTEQNRAREKNPSIENTDKRTEQNRGRERNPTLSSSNSVRRGARSQSPDRVSKYPWEEQETKNASKQTSNFSLFSKIGSRKWRLKDFFLFRSASEGRKYTALFKKHEEVRGFSSFRGIEGSSLRRKGNVSAHELHYTVNRAVSEDLKKKTPQNLRSSPCPASAHLRRPSPDSGDPRLTPATLA